MLGFRESQKENTENMGKMLAEALAKLSADNWTQLKSLHDTTTHFKPIIMKGLDLRSADLSEKTIYNVIFSECDFSWAKFPINFKIKRLSHLEGNTGIRVIPKTPHRNENESDEDFVQRKKRWNIQKSMIIVNGDDGVRVYLAPNHKKIDDAPESKDKPTDKSKVYFTETLDARSLAAVKEIIKEEGWTAPLLCRDIKALVCQDSNPHKFDAG